MVDQVLDRFAHEAQRVFRVKFGFTRTQILLSVARICTKEIQVSKSASFA